MIRRLLPVMIVLVAACEGGHDAPQYQAAVGGDATRGAVLIRAMGCGSCHTIPGIRGANGAVGPPLDFFSRRTYIAGQFPNSPSNLVSWLRDPPALQPGTAMPKLGLSDQQARDIAAYLYTLS